MAPNFHSSGGGGGGGGVVWRYNHPYKKHSQKSTHTHTHTHSLSLAMNNTHKCACKYITHTWGWGDVGGGGGCSAGVEITIHTKKTLRNLLTHTHILTMTHTNVHINTSIHTNTTALVYQTIQTPAPSCPPWGTKITTPTVCFWSIKIWFWTKQLSLFMTCLLTWNTYTCFGPCSYKIWCELLMHLQMDLLVAGLTQRTVIIRHHSVSDHPVNCRSTRRTQIWHFFLTLFVADEMHANMCKTNGPICSRFYMKNTEQSWLFWTAHKYETF